MGDGGRRQRDERGERRRSPRQRGRAHRSSFAANDFAISSTRSAPAVAPFDFAERRFAGFLFADLRFASFFFADFFAAPRFAVFFFADFFFADFAVLRFAVFLRAAFFFTAFFFATFFERVFFFAAMGVFTSLSIRRCGDRGGNVARRERWTPPILAQTPSSLRPSRAEIRDSARATVRGPPVDEGRAGGRVSDYPKTLDHTLAARNERDQAEVRGRLEQALSPEVRFIDPTQGIVGLDPFEKLVHAVRENLPDAVCSRAGGVDTHHRLYRYELAIHRSEELMPTGFDVVETDGAGPVTEVLGFLGPLPAKEQ